jgi:hypothetical protein
VAVCAPWGHTIGATQTEAARPGLGMTKESAIEVCGPSGDRAYFERLRCPDSSLVRYERMGSEGYRNDPKSKADEAALRQQMVTSAPIPTGQRDFHNVDGYTVECAAGKVHLYLDRFHCPEPKDQGTPPGFTFAKVGAAASPPRDGPQSGLGLSKETPIEVCGPNGELEYVRRLRCPDGSGVRSQRTGNMGARSEVKTSEDWAAAQKQSESSAPIPAGQRDFHLLDGFTAECAERKSFLYLDPYHCPERQNQGPPPGFSVTSGAKPQ